MTSEVHHQLDQFATQLADRGKNSHRTPAEFSDAVQMFIDIFKQQGFVHCEDVREFFLARNWSEDDATSISDLADVVWETMYELNMVSYIN